jgi:hypothetical protein
MAKKLSKPSREVQNRAFSVRQPYAEQIMRGEKKIEYRSILTHVRGRVYVYASNTPGPLEEYEAMDAKPGDFPTGVIVGTVEIVDCKKPTWKKEYHWLLANPRRLKKPIKPDNKGQPVWFIPFKK